MIIQIIALVSLFFATPTAVISDERGVLADISSVSVVRDSATAEVIEEIKTEPITELTNNHGIPNVPFYSQFNDISDPNWKKVGCGIAGLAMIIDFYKPGSVSVDKLLQEGINSGAYLNNAGWIHQGLINLSNNYGLGGYGVYPTNLSMERAFSKLEEELKNGPVIVSVHYEFDPKSTIPHLVVINGVEDGLVYYNDPAEQSGGGSISISRFQDAWKQRFIVIRPS